MDELIQWPRAKYWTSAFNPIIGCKPVSPACENCYAKAWAERFGQSFEPHKTGRQNPPRKGVVFCGNMTDLFGEWVEENCLKSLKFGKHATYLWLTKRPSKMRGRIWNLAFDERQHYFGITMERQEWLDRRLIEVGFGACWPVFAKGWFSLEPLLGQIDLSGVFNRFPWVKWVVVGCESGPKRRPCKVEWVERIVEQCRTAGVPVFVKQICLPDGRFTNRIEEFPKHLRIRQVPWAKKEEEAAP